LGGQVRVFPAFAQAGEGITQGRNQFRDEAMEKSKQQTQSEIEQARRVFYASGRRVRQLAPGDEVRTQNAKPRKQRLKMFA
jgi:hypothetical protein